MSKKITLELPDKAFVALKKKAEKVGLTVQEFAKGQLLSKVASRPKKKRMTAKEKEEAIRRFQACLGMFKGPPTGADNESIDRDLAKEYGRGLAGP